MILLLGAAAARADGSAAARRLLALGVRERWGLEELPALERRPGGKPCFPAFPQYHFNLPHTDGLCLCALSDAPVGVDAEQVRRRRAGLPRYVMSDAEFAAFDGSWEEFTRIWTLKEAYCKYLGRSIWPPRTVPVPPPVSFHTYSGPGWRAALCGTEPLPPAVQMLVLD